jgi:lysophospholipase L1-like esterase
MRLAGKLPFCNESTMKTKTTLLMLGDSLIEWGDWDKLLPRYNIVNRGIAGEAMEELSFRLNKEIRTADNPGYLLIMSGTNNLLMDDLFFPSILQTMLPRLRQLCPQSIISVNAILPMDIAEPRTKIIKDINRQLRRVAESAECSFLRVGNAFYRDCHPIAHPCFHNDGVHLSAFGYQIWAQEIDNHLRKLHENDGA